MVATFRFRKLRHWLALWFLVLALTPLITSGCLTYFQRVEAIRFDKIEKLTAIRDLKVRQVENWLTERSGDNEILSQSHEMKTVMKKYGSSKLSEIGQSEHEALSVLLHRYLELFHDYSELFLVDADDGSVIVSTDESDEGESKADYAYFSQAIDDQKAIISDIYFSKTVNGPSMVFTTPIFSQEDGHNLQALLVARVDLEKSLYRLLLDRTGMGATGETLLVNREGLALNDLRWHENAPLKLKITARPAVLASQGHTGVIEIEDYRQENVLAAYTHIPLADWGFVAKQDTAEAFAPVQAMLFDLLVQLVAFGTITAFISLYIGRKIVAPVTEMKDVSARLQAGDFSARNSTGGRHDELGFLAESINLMAGSIESQVKIQAGTGQVIEAIVAADDLKGFASMLIENLMDVTNSTMCAFFVRSNDNQYFENLVSIGMNADALRPFDAETMEGELGVALFSKKIERITDIPDETRFIFKAVAGQAVPKEVVTIPLLVRNEVKAIVSLSSLHAYSVDAMQVLHQSWVPINTAFANAISSEITRSLVEDLSAKNEELQVNAEELQSQSEELQSQSDELRMTATELERQRHQVEAADRLKSEFLSNMSHELRTPLNSVLALSQLMISRGTGKNPDEEKEFLEVIERNGKQLLSLINDVLDLSRIESGRMDVFVTDFDARQVATQALDTLRPLVRPKELVLTANLESAPKMTSDENKVNQILLNLLANAVKFTDEGTVSLDVLTKEDEVRFVVTDTGIGISEDELPHIFDEFRQVDGSLTRRHEGTGLGLAICQKLAELIGGEILVESVLGQGSTFTLRLPLRIDHGDKTVLQPVRLATLAGTNQRTKAPPVGKEHNLTILVVEDDKTAALQIGTALKENGFVAIHAASGEEALGSVEMTTPDGIVLDLMMPGVDGFAVLESIRSTPRTATLPVLVLTAKELTTEDRSRLSYNNIQQLIQKGSIDRSQLIQSLRAVFLNEKPTSLAREDVVKVEDLEEDYDGKVILIVEDNPDNLLSVTSVLTELNCNVAVAEDGHKAVEQAKKLKPTLILMDMQLPGISGSEATKRIHSLPGLEAVPVVALTANAMMGDRDKMLAIGCCDYLAKPFDQDELLETVRKWLK